MAKSVQLMERNLETGEFQKNENYELPELKLLIIDQNPGYFTRKFRGKRRREALEVVFETIANLIDQDEIGQHRLKIRKEEG